MDSSAFCKQRRRILTHRPSSHNECVNTTDAYSVAQCSQNETQTVSCISDMIAVYASDDFDTFEPGLSAPCLTLSGDDICLTQPNPSRVWRSGYGHRVVDSACFKWRLEILNRDGAFHVGITSEWKVLEEEVSSQWPYCCIEDDLPRSCVMFSTGLSPSGSTGFAVGDGFKYFNKRLSRERVEKHHVRLGDDVNAQSISVGDILEIDLDMTRRTVAFSVNSHFLFEVRNLKNVGFRLAVSVMRKDSGNPSLRIL